MRPGVRTVLSQQIRLVGSIAHIQGKCSRVLCFVSGEGFRSGVSLAVSMEGKVQENPTPLESVCLPLFSPGNNFYLEAWRNPLFFFPLQLLCLSLIFPSNVEQKIVMELLIRRPLEHSPSVGDH